MIRFINIGNQIEEEVYYFAFFDTVTDSFLTFNNSQTWNSIADFISDYNGDDMERFLDLIPMGSFPYDI